MPPNAGPYDIPVMMEGDNISVGSDDDDFVMLEMEDAESGGEEEDNNTQGGDGLTGYMPLMNNEDPSGNCVLYDQGTLVSADNGDNDPMPQPFVALEQSLPASPVGPSDEGEGRDTKRLNDVATVDQNETPINPCESLHSGSPRSDLKSMSTEHANLVKQAMASITLPTANIPDWAKEISEEQWKESLFSSITKREGKDC